MADDAEAGAGNAEVADDVSLVDDNRSMFARNGVGTAVPVVTDRRVSRFFPLW